MAVNDAFMLPKRVRTMEQMADLMASEQTELTQTQRTITALENQLTISNSTFLLLRYERLFSLPVNPSDNLEERRSRVLARLNTRSPTTVQAVKELVKIITGYEADVAEVHSLYSFELNFHYIDRVIDCTALNDALDVMKPAHLVFGLTFTAKEARHILGWGTAAGSAGALPGAEQERKPPPASAVYAGGPEGTVCQIQTGTEQARRGEERLRTGGTGSLFITAPGRSVEEGKT